MIRYAREHCQKVAKCSKGETQGIASQRPSGHRKKHRAPFCCWSLKGNPKNPNKLRKKKAQLGVPVFFVLFLFLSERRPWRSTPPRRHCPALWPDPKSLAAPRQGDTQSLCRFGGKSVQRPTEEEPFPFAPVFFAGKPPNKRTKGPEQLGPGANWHFEVKLWRCGGTQG